jgi:hypothetical protein
MLLINPIISEIEKSIASNERLCLKWRLKFSDGLIFKSEVGTDFPLPTNPAGKPAEAAP